MDIVVAGLLLTAIVIPAVIGLRIDLESASTAQRERRIRADMAELAQVTQRALLRKQSRESDVQP